MVRDHGASCLVQEGLCAALPLFPWLQLQAFPHQQSVLEGSNHSLPALLALALWECRHLEMDLPSHRCALGRHEELQSLHLPVGTATSQLPACTHDAILYSSTWDGCYLTCRADPWQIHQNSQSHGNAIKSVCQDGIEGEFGKIEVAAGGREEEIVSIWDAVLHLGCYAPFGILMQAWLLWEL